MPYTMAAPTCSLAPAALFSFRASRQCPKLARTRVQGGAIYLCGRADGDPSRYYSGAVSHVSIWDDAVLTRQQITDLYRTILLATLTDFKLRDANDAAPVGAPARATYLPAPGSSTAQIMAGAPQASATNYYMGSGASAPQQAPAAAPVRRCLQRSACRESGCITGVSCMHAHMHAVHRPIGGCCTRLICSCPAQVSV